ncbi:DUF3040 domain-containing protein [Actinacidiphila sp. bgisy160]|uniref:DUF3040 domain-containing protein n=1 Tax=Actinacidiphila sp. bgisy160 TaxID=3413796 RepID=UPI003D7432FD
MPRPHKAIEDIEAEIRRTDPCFAEGLRTGRPCAPREYRRRLGRLLLVVALAWILIGIMLPQGLLMAAGLVLDGIGAGVLDPRHDTVGRGRRRV